MGGGSGGCHPGETGALATAAAFDSVLRAGILQGIRGKPGLPGTQRCGGPGSAFSHLELMEMKG